MTKPMDYSWLSRPLPKMRLEELRVIYASLGEAGELVTTPSRKGGTKGELIAEIEMARQGYWNRKHAEANAPKKSQPLPGVLPASEVNAWLRSLPAPRISE